MTIKSLDQLTSHVCTQITTQVADLNSAETTPTSVVVGYSGGLDSSVLLHLLASIQPQLKTFSVSAIHVNHGIHPLSDKWADFCQLFCNELNVALHISSYTLAQVKTNREAIFRQARYQAFADYLPHAGLLLTAHHQGDQVETVLFNLFRGAGVRGLRAMKACLPFASGRHLRPLLPVSRPLLLAYAKRHQLNWIDDPSNADINLDRNYIRHQLMPVIEKRWPTVQTSISRSALNMIESEHILEEVASQDEESCQQPDYPGVIDNAYLATLDIERIRQLSKSRQLNLLRHWILTHTSVAISADQLHQIDGDLCANPGSGLFEFMGYELRVFKHTLYLMQAIQKPIQAVEKPLINNEIYEFDKRCLRLKLHWESMPGSRPDLHFASRSGGEKIRHHGQNQQLKTIYQNQAVPTWERDLIPLIYHDNRLIAVPGVVLADDSPIVQSWVSKYTPHMS